MKVKISKTGEIKAVNHGQVLVHFSDGTTKSYKSISDLSDDLKDYEEPKEYWYINCYGEVLHALYNGNEWDERRKLIGNYFETEEEAENVVEKLKAWKRLRDKGLKNIAWDWGKINNPYREDDGEIYIKVMLNTENYDSSWDDDLDLLFGGEE